MQEWKMDINHHASFVADLIFVNAKNWETKEYMGNGSSIRVAAHGSLNSYQ